MKKVVEPGTFTISVGASSLEKDLHKAILRVK
jgi:beta-glucosidase